MLNQVVTQTIRIGTSIYLMRLLSPESFGVFMKVLAVVGVSEILIGFRLGGGIVQATKTDNKQISTIFAVTFTGALILALLFILFAEPLSAFYGDYRLAPIMRMCSVAVLFLGLGYVPFSLLTKKLEFKKIFIANSIGIIISSSTGIWMALRGFDYWSLVWQWLLFNSITSVIFFGSTVKHLSFNLPLSGIQGIWAFSKKLLYDDLLNYGVKNIDNIMVGKFLGSAELGYYSRAYNLMLIPIQNFINVIRGILFPAFSRIQDEKERIKNIFMGASQAVSFIMLPFFLFALIYTPDLVVHVLGTHWLPIVPILRIFLVMAMIQSHTALISSVYLSLGKSSLMFRFGFISRPLLLVAIVIAIQFGLMPLVVTVTIINSVISLAFIIIGLTLINSKLVDLLSRLKSIVFVNIAIYGSLLLYSFIFAGGITPLWQLVTLLVGSLFLYILFFERTKPAFYLELKSHLPGTNQ